MALTLSAISDPFASKVVNQTQTTSTADEDVTGGAGGTMYMLQVDNTLNTHITYVKLKDGPGSGGGGSIVVGTDDPDWIFTIPASQTKTIAMPNGVAFTSTLSFWAVKEAGTPGTTSPDSNTAVVLLAD
jgi:hypothetical protein